MLNELKEFQAYTEPVTYTAANKLDTAFAHEIIGYVAEELITRGVLEKPDKETPLTDGVFFVEGKYINV